MAIATLRIIKPSIVNGRLSTEYNRTFVCKDYPGIGMSQIRSQVSFSGSDKMAENEELSIKSVL